MDLHKIDPQSWKQDLPAFREKTAEFYAGGSTVGAYKGITAATPRRAARPACCACACPAAA